MQNKSAYLWSLIGRIVPQAIYLGTTMILARFLSASDFGILGILSVFLMVANTLLDAGFGGSLVNEKNLTKDDCSTVFTFSLGMSFLLYIIMYIAAPFLESFYSAKGLTVIIRILCLIFPIQAFALVPSSLLVKQLQFKRLTVIRIVAIICASALSVLYAYYNRNVYALVIYQLCQAFVISVCVNINSSFKLQFLFKKESFDRLFSFGLFTTLANIIDTIYENLLAMIFGKAVSVQEAGYLSQAKRIEEISTQTVTQTINSTSFPILSKKKNAIVEFTDEASSIFSFSILMITPLMLVLSLFSEPIIVLLFGKEWSNAAFYLSLLSVAGVFIIMETLNRTFIKSLGEVTVLFRVTLIKRAIGIVILIVCLLIDVKWILYGYILSSIIAYLINQTVYCKIIHMPLFQSVFETLFLLIPSLLFYVVSKIFLSLIVAQYIQVLIIVLLLCLYYLIVYMYLMKKK